MKFILIVVFLLGHSLIANCEIQECDTYSWHCDSGECIEDADRCDGIVNCSDGSDETVENCISNQCAKFAFRCLYGACVNGNAACNGKKECVDGSDEMTAKCPSSKLKDLTQGVCQAYQYQCGSKECIDIEAVCDGRADCSDESDESIDICAAISCPTYAFRCGYGACVSGNAKCNGKKDCVDSSDENYLLCNYTKPDAKPTTTTRKPDVVTELTVPTGACRLVDIPRNGDVFYESDPNAVALAYGEVVDSFISVKYRCIHNHHLIGNDTNFCFSGEWTAKAPECKARCNPKDINGVTIVPNCIYGNNSAHVSCDQPAKPETRAMINCARGYERPGVYQQVVTCGDDGRWNPIPHRCTQVCGEESPEASPYIVGGIVTNITKVPWHVGIYKKMEADGPFLQWCGGTIINAKVVLSAMHCFWDRTEFKPFPETEFSVAAGKFKREYSALEDLKAQFFAVDKIYYQDGYTDIDGLFAADIALVVLQSYIEFKTYIMPICVPYGLDYEDKIVQSGWVGRVAGWGLEESSGKPSPLLKVIELPAVSRADCTKTSTPEFRPFITNDKFCAGYLTGVSVCQGDSGGGLVFAQSENGKTKYYVRGVVSTGANKANSCDNDKYATFTNVAFYLDFLSNYDVQYQPK